MSDNCYDPADLERVHHLPTDDPDRLHLAECTRCRALLAAYERFIELGKGAPDTGEMAAEETLGNFLEEEILGSAPVDRPEPLPIPGMGRPAAPPRFRLRQLSWPLAAAAALAVVFGLQQVLRDPSAEGDKVQLRDGATGQVDEVLVLESVMTSADGSLRLAWRPFPEASAYRVVLFDDRLREVAAFPVEGEPVFLLTAEQMGELPDQAAGLLWRVLALQNGDLIGRSALAPLVGR